MPNALGIGLLGSLQVRDEAGRPVHVGGRQLRVLLTLLALNAGRVVPAGSLAGELWPDDPPGNPGNALQTLISWLRAVREPVIARRAAEPGTGPLDRLAAALGDRDEVLILDNCEHVIEAAAALAGHVLAACPRLRILATSRQPLRIDGETLCPVLPLPSSCRPRWARAPRVPGPAWPPGLRCPARSSCRTA